MFLKNKTGQYQTYSNTCPWQNKRVPVVISEEEKQAIDKADEESNTKSYDEVITYGSDKTKKNHYICPRFWCFTENRSLSLKQVNDGECGGWDSVIDPKERRILTKNKYTSFHLKIP